MPKFYVIILENWHVKCQTKAFLNAEFCFKCSNLYMKLTPGPKAVGNETKFICLLNLKQTTVNV